MSYGYGDSSGTSYGGGGGYGGVTDDFSSAFDHASNHAGSSGDKSLFSSALSMLGEHKQSLQNENVDEDDAINQHKAYYGSGSGSGGYASSGGIGTAAAMEALKKFTGGEASSGGGHAQNQFVGMAMAQASKLFDQQHAAGNTTSESSKQDAVNTAAKMALKMYMKSEMGGSSGSSSGGGGLMSLASKFMS